jgi:hypothetical protein
MFEIYNKKYTFYFKKVEWIRKALKSKFKKLNFSLTTNGENRNTYKNKVKTIKKIIDKAFRIVKSNDNKEEVESENERDKKKKRLKV